MILKHIWVEELYLHGLSDRLSHYAFANPKLVRNQESILAIPLHVVPFISIDITEQRDEYRDRTCSTSPHDLTNLYVP